MPTLEPMTVAELEASISDTRARLADPDGVDRAASLDALRTMHESLMRATALTADPPIACLQAVAEVADGVPARLPDSLSPRPRTVYRLLRAGAVAAAWAVLADNATGVVDEAFQAATATGAARTAWRLPLLTRLEPPAVFVELPGFRDPRYDAPDDCYDITGAVDLTAHVDEVWTDGSVVRLGGWALLDVLPATAGEQVRLHLTRNDETVTVEGRRVRRPDLVSGRGEALTRRAWAGWTVSLDLSDPRVTPGTWGLALEVEHEGMARRAPLGRRASDLARAATAQVVELDPRSARWDTTGRGWRLVVSEVDGKATSDTVGG